MEIIYAFLWLYGQIVSRLWNKKFLFAELIPKKFQ